eukprot:6067785-Pyramimonas_sp.AAC.1
MDAGINRRVVSTSRWWTSKLVVWPRLKRMPIITVARLLGDILYIGILCLLLTLLVLLVVYGHNNHLLAQVPKPPQASPDVVYRGGRVVIDAAQRGSGTDETDADDGEFVKFLRFPSRIFATNISEAEARTVLHSALSKDSAAPDCAKQWYHSVRNIPLVPIISSDIISKPHVQEAAASIGKDHSEQHLLQSDEHHTHRSSSSEDTADASLSLLYNLMQVDLARYTDSHLSEFARVGNHVSHVSHANVIQLLGKRVEHSANTNLLHTYNI